MARAFAGLRRSGPRSRYDAVVVGSGIGGLVAANLLAEAGRSVLLVEQHYMTGGYCSTFRRGGYTFDAATHFYPLLGNPATLTGRLLARLGCTTQWVKMDPVDTFHFPDGSRFDVPADLESYLREVKAAFPHEATAIDRFFATAKEAYLYGLAHFFRGLPAERLGERLGWTLADALAAHFGDRKLRLLLAADCAHWGSPPSRTSFVFDSMLRFSYFLGNYYPVGGSQAFPDELARCLEARGGDILMSTCCTGIVVADGRACGVELETTRGPLTGRHRVAADAVVCNADLRQTIERLLPAGAVPAALAEQVRAMRLSFPCFLSHLGMRDVAPEELAAIQGYYWDDWDADRVGEDGLRCKIFAPTLYEPAMAPPGGQVVILQKVLAMDAARVDDWLAHKHEVEERLLCHLERVLPDARRRIVTRSSATARTSERFTWNSGGAMLGWEMSPDQLGEARPPVEGPLPGLWLVGHWTRPGGGITPVIVSATHTAERILGEG